MNTQINTIGYQFFTKDTSKKSRGQKALDKIVQPFAVRIFGLNNRNSKLQKYANLARNLKLTNDDLTYAEEGQYLVFGADDYYDITVVSKSELPTKRILYSDAKITDAIEEMAFLNDYLYDYYEDNSYRSKVDSHIEETSQTQQCRCRSNRRPILRSTRQEHIDFDVDVPLYIDDCDDFLFVGDEVIEKGKNDIIKFYLP